MKNLKIVSGVLLAGALAMNAGAQNYTPPAVGASAPFMANITSGAAAGNLSFGAGGNGTALTILSGGNFSAGNGAMVYLVGANVTLGNFTAGNISGTLPAANVTGLGALATNNTVNLATQVSGSLAWANVTGLPSPNITINGDGNGTTTLTNLTNGNLTLTLGNTGVTAGTYGTASSVAQPTFDATGRATGASNVSIQIGESQVTSLTSDLGLKAPLASPTFTGTTTDGNLTVTGSANLTGGGSLAGTFSGNPSFSGNVVISAPVSTIPNLQVTESGSWSSGMFVPLFALANNTLSANSTNAWSTVGFVANAYISGNTGSPNAFGYGEQLGAWLYGSGNIGYLYGSQNQVLNESSGTIFKAYVYNPAIIEQGNGGNIALAMNNYAQGFIGSAGNLNTVGAGYNYYSAVWDMAGGSNITGNFSGFYNEDLTPLEANMTNPNQLYALWSGGGNVDIYKSFMGLDANWQTNSSLTVGLFGSTNMVSGQYNAINAIPSITPLAGSAAQLVAIYANPAWMGTQNSSGYLIGLQLAPLCWVTGGGHLGTVESIYSNPIIENGNATVTNLYGLYNSMYNLEGATVANAIGDYQGLYEAGNSTTTTYIAFEADTPVIGTSNITNYYGLKVNALPTVTGASNYSIYTVNGNVVLGTAAANLGSGVVIGNTLANATAGAALTVNGNISALHLMGNSTAPTVAAGSAAGAGNSTSIVGNDAFFKVTLITGNTTGLTGAAAVVTFNAPYVATPHVVAFAANGNTAALSGATAVYGASNTSAWTLNTGSSALSANTTYVWECHAGQ